MVLRSVKETITLLSVMRVEHISLDYDLGYDCMIGLDIMKCFEECENVFTLLFFVCAPWARSNG